MDELGQMARFCAPWLYGPVVRSGGDHSSIPPINNTLADLNLNFVYYSGVSERESQEVDYIIKWGP